jgi:hypothetical protein
VIKPQPPGRANHIWANGNQFAFCEGTHDKGARCEEDSVIKTPYGVPGDRLWVFGGIFLKITDVHVERLNDIMPESIIKEGPPDEVYFSEDPKAPLEWFRGLWDSISKDKPGRAWGDNPWVWVITFEVVK